MKTGLLKIILIAILLFMQDGMLVKIDGFMNENKKETNDKDTMNAVLNESMIKKKRDIKLKMCYYIQNKIRW